MTLGAVWRAFENDLADVYRVGNVFSPIFYEASTKIVRASPDITWLAQALPTDLSTAFDAAAAVTGLTHSERAPCRCRGLTCVAAGGSWIKFTSNGTPYIGYFMTLPNVVGQDYVAGTFWENTNGIV